MNISKKYFLIFTTGLIFFLSVGCVTRTLTINTNPSHAKVYIDNEFAGESPVVMPFVYYGTRKIMIERRDADGRLTHKRQIAYEKIKAPAYEVFPLDFFSEVLWPFNIKDDHTLNYELEELKPQTRKELQKSMLEKADELRQKIHSPDF